MVSVAFVFLIHLLLFSLQLRKQLKGKNIYKKGPQIAGQMKGHRVRREHLKSVVTFKPEGELSRYFPLEKLEVIVREK